MALSFYHPITRVPALLLFRNRRVYWSPILESRCIRPAKPTKAFSTGFAVIWQNKIDFTAGIHDNIADTKGCLYLINRYIYIYFEVKLTFEMLAVRGHKHSYSTHERVFLWKCQSFWDRKCLDLRGTRTPNLRIHAECFNLLSYQGQTFAVPCFYHWLWWYRYFLSRVNIWNVNCALTNSIHFRHTNGYSSESVFWDRKGLDLRGTRSPTFVFMPNALTYWAIRARHLLSHVFEHWLWWYIYFWSEINIWNVNCALAKAFIFETQMGIKCAVCDSWQPTCRH